MQYFSTLCKVIYSLNLCLANKCMSLETLPSRIINIMRLDKFTIYYCWFSFYRNLKKFFRKKSENEFSYLLLVKIFFHLFSPNSSFYANNYKFCVCSRSSIIIDRSRFCIIKKRRLKNQPSYIIIEIKKELIGYKTSDCLS